MSQHFYSQNGKLVNPHTPKALPSATTILDVINKPELNEWRLRVGPQTALKRQEESSKRGTAIHQLVSDWIDGRPVEAESEDHEEALHGFINWTEKVQPTETKSEIFVHSKKYGYAGTADIICRLRGQLWIIDIKTSKSISPAYGLQLRAYEQAYFERTGEHARIAVLQLTNTNKSGYRFKELDAPLEVFVACKTLFDWQRQFDKTPKFDGRYISA